MGVDINVYKLKNDFGVKNTRIIIRPKTFIFILETVYYTEGKDCKSSVDPARSLSHVLYPARYIATCSSLLHSCVHYIIV